MGSCLADVCRMYTTSPGSRFNTRADMIILFASELSKRTGTEWLVRLFLY